MEGVQWWRTIVGDLAEGVVETSCGRLEGLECDLVDAVGGRYVATCFSRLSLFCCSPIASMLVFFLFLQFTRDPCNSRETPFQLPA